MHILRWLLTHPIIFAWALAILAILLNYGVGGGSGEDTHQAEAEHSTEQAKVDDGEVKAESAAEGEVVATAQQAVSEVTTQTAETTDAAVESVKETVAETTEAAAGAVEEVKAVVADASDSASGTVAKVAAVAGAATAVVAGSVAADSGEEATAEASTSEETQEASTSETAQAADTTTEAASTETAEATTESATASEEAQVAEATIEEAAESATASEEVQATTEGAASTETAGVASEETEAVAADAETSDHDLLHAAREAYWSNEFDRSAEFYQSLLQRAAQPSIKGELANVFWKQGKSAEAVALYAEIAPWLREQNRTAELQNMKVYADLVDPAKGEEIGAWLE